LLNCSRTHTFSRLEEIDMTCRLTVSAALFASIALTAACSDSGFGGGGAKGARQADTASHSGAVPTDPNATATTGGTEVGGSPSSADLTPPPDATPEQAAIGKCLATWGKSQPFGKAAFTDYHEIAATVSVFGSGYAVEDDEATSAPKLILIHAAVAVLGEANYRLMNPNGWYCFMVGVNVLAKSKVELQCKAKLADNRVNVNVGSNASATSAVGVNVFSDVKVERKQTAEAAPGC
jgi:hypothetical protein